MKLKILLLVFMITLSFSDNLIKRDNYNIIIKNNGLKIYISTNEQIIDKCIKCNSFSSPIVKKIKKCTINKNFTILKFNPIKEFKTTKNIKIFKYPSNCSEIIGNIKNIKKFKSEKYTKYGWVKYKNGWVKGYKLYPKFINFIKKDCNFCKNLIL